jgi:predicted component of type VI protein secretion system
VTVFAMRSTPGRGSSSAALLVLAAVSVVLAGCGSSAPAQKTPTVAPAGKAKPHLPLHLHPPIN